MAKDLHPHPHPPSPQSVLLTKDPEWVGKAESYPGSTRTMTIGFPMMNMWAHTMPLYSILSVIGTTFTESGLVLRPRIVLHLYDYYS